MTATIDTYDPTYARRYANRNKHKIDMILSHVGTADAVLDIGCNAGYVSIALLESGQAKRVDGIELNVSVVEKRLLANDAFELHQCNIVDFVFKKVYDVVIYAAVHHHVLGTAGVETGWNLWQRIIEHCNETLIFETGLFAEEGEYYWKDTIRNHFIDDTTYLRSLFHAVGPRLRDVTKVATVPIHGVVRPLYILSLWPLHSEFDLRDDQELYGEMYSSEDSWQVLDCYHRTIGRNQQQLVSMREPDHSKNERLYKDSEFRLLRHRETGSLAFSKKSISDPYKQMREFRILQCLDHPNVIKLIEVNKEHGLVFPYMPWLPLSSVDFKAVTNIQEIKNQIADFFRFATSVEIDMGILGVDLEMSIAKSTGCLIDFVDMHSSNFLLKIVDGCVSDWVLVDMEYFSSNNRQRNERNEQLLLTYLDPPKQRFLEKIKRRLAKLF